MQALIIDDEKHCRDGLSIMLAKYCPEVEVLALCPNAGTAMQAIRQYHPDLIFLDVEMPGTDGFELLECCKEYDFEIIFTTAHDRYAIEAIRHSALGYLLKPVNRNELVTAVTRAKEGNRVTTRARVLKMRELLDARKGVERIALPTIDGLIIVDTNEILYCESENNYTRFHIANGKSVFISKTLKKVESLLINDTNFFRSHHSFIINLKYLQRYVRGDGGEVILANGKTLPVSRTKKQEFLDKLDKL
jgi:two-component system LytT family response regulator